MTSKRSSQTYTGLKALLVSGSLGASLLGVYMLANKEARLSTHAATPTPRPTAIPTLALESDVAALRPIPTAVKPYVLDQQPTPQPNVAAQGAPASGGQPDTGVQPGAPAVPTAMSMDSLPPLPAPPAPPMQPADQSSSPPMQPAGQSSSS
jgi:hypothetical protein